MEENTFTMWAKRHSSKLFLFVLAAVAFGIFFERNRSSKLSHSHQDYFVITHLFDRFEKGEPISSEAIETAETILIKHPELHPSYDSLLTLSFFQQENSAKAIAYADSVLTRTEKLFHSPYQTFGKISLIIAKNEIEEALSQSQKLEEELKADGSYEILRGYNLFRMALLEKQKGNNNKAKEIWMLTKAIPSFAQVSTLFNQGTYTLDHYFSKS